MVLSLSFSSFQRRHRQKHENAFQDDERGLLLDEASIVSVLELGHSVGATGQDEERRRRQAGEEGGEPPAEARGAAGPEVADHVVCEGDDEEDEDDDLKTESRLRDVDSGLVGAGGVGRQGAPGGLEDKAENVKGDEDVVEELGLEAREVRSEVDDRLRQGHQDPANITDNLSHASQEHRDGEAPAPPPEAEMQVSKEGEAKEDGKDDRRLQVR
ncbi:hypothetical protein Trco_005968 [Trichoderma cornu-damae]|uniref:Uncharacterized protein n=1 Tax=Trichoderma cornu-damae TaxID=654480 RepID=A0A9P8QI79_9HYPO|nr:hypothetical protein Trco_005968 [Trichoderma cornu-damae]